jgi:alginate O-acetyltransferase complex protein AlgJ
MLATIRSRPRLALTFAAIALGFFFAPALAYVAGVRGHPLENRPATAFPDIAKTRFHSFAPVTQWALDRLPLRSDAVRARVRLTRRIFGELPDVIAPSGPAGAGQLGNLTSGVASESAGLSRSEQVLLGRKNWLFLGEDFAVACAPEQPVASVARGIERLDRILRRSGRRLVLAIAPDKSTLSPGFLPADLPERKCARAERRRRAAALAALPREIEDVDLRSALARQQARTGPIYLPEDTHWDSLGGKVFVSSVMRELEPSLLRRTRWTQGPPMPYTGDLAIKSGDPVTRSQPSYELRRAGVRLRRAGQQVIAPGYAIQHQVRTRTRDGATLYEPTTTFYGDSFTDLEAGDIYAFFRNVYRVPALDAAVLGGYEPAADRAFVETVKRSQTVVIEVAERIFWGRRGGSVVAPKLLDQLQRGLGEPK